MERNTEAKHMSNFRKAIQVGMNATDILKLPCVRGCSKVSDILVYNLYEWDENGNEIEAKTGDWLCEDHDGRWHVLNEEEYEKQKEML